MLSWELIVRGKKPWQLPFYVSWSTISHRLPHCFYLNSSMQKLGTTLSHLNHLKNGGGYYKTTGTWGTKGHLWGTGARKRRWRIRNQDAYTASLPLSTWSLHVCFTAHIYFFLFSLHASLAIASCPFAPDTGRDSSQTQFQSPKKEHLIGSAWMKPPSLASIPWGLEGGTIDIAQPVPRSLQSVKEGQSQWKVSCALSNTTKRVY